MRSDSPGSDGPGSTDKPDGRHVLSLASLLLAHHNVDQLTHCYKVRAGSRIIHVCARCVGLYPAMAAAMVAATAVWPDLRFRPEIMVVACLPAVMDWAAVRLGFTQGRNSMRTLTGTLAGLGLGLCMPGYFRNPGDAMFWWSLAVLVVVVGLVEFVARVVKP